MLPRDARDGPVLLQTRTKVERAAPGELFDAKLLTPFAVLGIRTAGELVTHIEYLPRGIATLAPTNKLAARVCRQIEKYLADPEFQFDLPFEYRGTAFQQRVWRALRAIPAGTTASYAEVARKIGAPRAVRAVARAIASNPIAVAIPCHRVIASDGALTGYRWGLARKRALLDREAK